MFNSITTTPGPRPDLFLSGPHPNARMATIKWRIKRRRLSTPIRNRKFGLANKKQSLITNNTKPAWLDHNGQFSSAILFMSAALLIPLLSSEYRSVQQQRERFDVCVLSLAMVVLLAGILKVFSSGISGKEIPQNKKVNIYLLLTLLTGASVTYADLAVLNVVDKSYRYFTPVPVLQIVLLAWLSYLDLKSDQTERTVDDSTKNETMIKNCFKVLSVVTSACYAMQAALLFGNYLKAIDFSEGAIHYSLEATFLTSAVGCSAMVMTSSPLPFRNEFVHFFLSNVPMVMSFLVWVTVTILSTQFLPGTILAFAGIIPVTVEILVYLICKTWQQLQATAAPSSTTTENVNVEVDSTFGGVIPLSIGLITMIYVNFGREEHLHDWYMIIPAVFCLLSSITFSLIRLLFPFRAECTSAKRSICSVLAIGPLLLGFALILIEMFCAHNHKLS